MYISFSIEWNLIERQGMRICEFELADKKNNGLGQKQEAKSVRCTVIGWCEDYALWSVQDS